MLQLAGYYENTELPLLGAARIAQEDTERRFATETDPDGTPWIPLDPDYLESTAKQESSHPDDILQLTGEMKDAATSPTAWRVVSDTLVFDPSGLPFYAEYHQKGSGAENAGVAFGHKEAIRGGGTGSQKESLGIGRGNALPARPFIGLSEEAIAEIVTLFDSWFEEGINNIAIHPRTGVAQLRTALGRFGPRI